MSNKDASFCTFVSQVNIDDSPIEDSYETIFNQYEKVVVQALVSSFGLDFLIQDQHGGDVDTIHNVREIGKDPEMKFKNQQNAKNYSKRGKYDSASYHKDQNYTDINARVSADKKAGKLYDSYTGKKVKRNAKIDLDHAVSAKEIHNDPGRVLAGLDGKKLANTESNLKPTDRSINRSMHADNMAEYLKKWKEKQPERQAKIKELKNKASLTDKERKELNKLEKLEEIDPVLMLEEDRKARKAIDEKVNRVYYTSKKFWKDSKTAALKLGLSMGLRQALGLVFTEIWFTVKDSIIQCKGNGKALFDSIAKAVKQGLKNAKKKFREIWEKFIEGAVAGVLSSLVTTLANIFFTTAKNAIKIIRESFASLSQASKILFINPDCYSLGDRFVVAAKVMATGASVIAGSMVKELFKTTPIAGIPIIKDVVPTFCSVLITGIMSCSLLHILDHNKYIKKAVIKLDQLPDIDNFNVALTKQCELLDKYLAEFMKIDFDLLKQQEDCFLKASTQLSTCKSLEETNQCLSVIYSQLKIKLPWHGYKDFDSFMKDRKSTLVFS